jgi:hypothetical protein
MMTTTTTTVHKQCGRNFLPAKRNATEKGDRHIKISKAPAVFPGNPNKQH